MLIFNKNKKTSLLRSSLFNSLFSNLAVTTLFFASTFANWAGPVTAYPVYPQAVIPGQAGRLLPPTYNPSTGPGEWKFDGAR